MRTLQVSDETFEKIKGQLIEDEGIAIESYEDLIGKQWFFRTVTYHFTGKVVKITGSFAQLENAAWIADSGRFMQAVRDGKLNEVEPLGTWFVNLTTVTDFGPWKHQLPEKQI